MENPWSAEDIIVLKNCCAHPPWEAAVGKLYAQWFESMYILIGNENVVVKWNSLVETLKLEDLSAFGWIPGVKSLCLFWWKSQRIFLDTVNLISGFFTVHGEDSSSVFCRSQGYCKAVLNHVLFPPCRSSDPSYSFFSKLGGRRVSQEEGWEPGWSKAAPLALQGPFQPKPLCELVPQGGGMDL